MKAAYEANPIMGDPHSVEGQMEENSQKLAKLKTELHKFQGYLDDVNGKPETPYASKKSHHRNSISESESLSRSASDSSFSQQNGSSAATGKPDQLSRLPAVNSNSTPVENGQKSEKQTPESDKIQNDLDEEGEFEDVLPVLGKARALYAFEGEFLDDM
jgi:hypothetical protein